VADPLGEVERLDARLGLELSGAARQRMTRWIGRDHHRRRGRPHRYSLADFGLDPAEVDRRFARYREWVTASRARQFLEYLILLTSDLHQSAGRGDLESAAQQECGGRGRS
jgi:hypothetical protein